MTAYRSCSTSTVARTARFLSANGPAVMRRVAHNAPLWLNLYASYRGDALHESVSSLALPAPRNYAGP